MDQILYQYEINPTTWVYVSSMMTIGIYFKFGRFWSVRNLDLLALIALAPGLLLVQHGADTEAFGYAWLFALGVFWLVRLLADPMMVRRPLLEPNLSPGGLTFMCVSLLVFLMTNVITAEMTPNDLQGAQRLDEVLSRQSATADDGALDAHGPGYPLLHLLARVPNSALLEVDETLPQAQSELMFHTATARTMAILSHLAIVFGIMFIGYRHFGNLRMGIAAAALYLLLPCTAQMVGRVDHVLPAALLVWAIASYRRPLLSGMLIGLAAGAIYYPIFLLPLWISFYWQRGLVRFLCGVAAMLALLTATLVLTSADSAAFWGQVSQMFGFSGLSERPTDGFWHFNEPAYRIPIVATFCALCLSMAIWPAQKNLGTLLSCSAAVMLGTQFWHAPSGGLYVAWYLPLLLLTVFRPNLEDRVALSVLGAGWFARRRTQPIRGIVRAA